jgi:hypothetical protein
MTMIQIVILSEAKDLYRHAVPTEILRPAASG